MFGPLVLAQDLYVKPANEVARQVQNLFNITLWIAIFVFVFVMGLMLYIIIKFRNNTKVPREEGHRGHATAEVVWTVIPAAILLFIGFISAGTLIQIDTIPDDTDFTVRIEALQFAWRFIYPDVNGTAYSGQPTWCQDDRTRCSLSEFRIQEGSRVKAEIVGRDVIHAFAIPEFSIKADAVPGKIHTVWFEAPMVNGVAQEYFVQCMEFCGVGHHDMRAKMVVFPAGEQVLKYGQPPAP